MPAQKKGVATLAVNNFNVYRELHEQYLDSGSEIGEMEWLHENAQSIQWFSRHRLAYQYFISNLPQVFSTVKRDSC